MASTDKAVYTIELNDKLTPGVKKAIASSLGLDKQMGKTRGKVRKNKAGIGALSGAFSRLTGPIALAAAAMKAFNVASESVRLARDFESLENSINFASGSAREGARNMKFLRDQTKRLGLPLMESTEGFKTLAASMMGSSLEGDPTREIFEGVSVAATAMGLSAEDAKGTFLALGQIMGKGKVQAEELRGQIGERIPGAFNIAAKAMGTTQAGLNKMMEQGELVATEFLPKFAAELKNTFQGALPKAMESSRAQLNRFNNMWLDLKLKLGRLLLPMVNKVMAQITKLVNFLSQHKTFIYNNIITPLIGIFNVFKDAYVELFAELTEGFSTSASAADIFRGIIVGIGKALKIAIPIIKFVVTILKNIWVGIISAWKLHFKIVMGFWKALYGGILYVVTLIKQQFLGLKDIIAGAITLDSSQIAKGVNTFATAGRKAAKAFSDVWETDTSMGGVMSKISDMVGGAGKQPTGPAQKPWASLLGPSKTVGAGGGSNIPFKAKAAVDTKKSSTSVDGIKSGRPTHINIDIGKLIENMNITASNIDDLTGQIKDQVAQALFSAVNNVNNIAGN